MDSIITLLSVTFLGILSQQQKINNFSQQGFPVIALQSWVMAPPDFFYRLNVTLVVGSGGKWSGNNTQEEWRAIIGKPCWLKHVRMRDCWENTADWNDLNSSFFFHTCNMKPQLCSWDTNPHSPWSERPPSAPCSLFCVHQPGEQPLLLLRWQVVLKPLIKLLAGLHSTTQGMNLKSPYLVLWKN